MDPKLQSLLDNEDRIPNDVPHWIVESHHEYDQRDLTPLQAVTLAVSEIRENHCWRVIHVRSGLQWSVCLKRQEVIEIVTTKK
jgi:hypothetical protein